MPAARISPASTALSNTPIGLTGQRSSAVDSHRRRLLKSQSTNDSISSDGSDHISSSPNINGSVNSLVSAYHNHVDKSDGVLTPYQRVIRCLNSDERWQREITLGRRIGFYRFRGDIGTGNFSQVKVAMHCLTKEKVAVKILDKCKLDAKTQRMLAREIVSMEELHHPNLIRIFEVIETLSKFHLIMEYAPGGELFQKITSEGRLLENDAKPLFAQIVAAVDHMHFHNIVHRDIKAENVFFADQKTVKVGDFGFSIKVGSKDDLLSTFCGSPPYAAPELFHDESYGGPFVDYWSLGVLLYFMVTASMPFKAQTISALKKLILEGVYEQPSYLTKECLDVIKGLLKQKPDERTNLDALRGTEWLNDQTFPSSLPRYKLQPATSPKMSDIEEVEKPVQLSPDEREAHRVMKELGIDDLMIQDSLDKGSRCNVTGTFRIILHRIINTRYMNSVNGISNAKMVEQNNSNNNYYNREFFGSKSWKSIKSMKNFISERTCMTPNGEDKKGVNFIKNRIIKMNNSKNCKKSKACSIL